ncbi:MAG: hypothetical protein ACK5N8_08215 [Alphaproteobacteria bacterium]
MAAQYNIFNIDEKLEEFYTKEQISDAKENKTYDKMLEKLYSDLEKNGNSLDDKLKSFDDDANEENNSDYKIYANDKENNEDLMGVTNFALSEEADYQAYKNENPNENDAETRQAFRGERDTLVRSYMKEVEGHEGDYSEDDYARLVTLAKEWDSNRGASQNAIVISDNESEGQSNNQDREWESRYYEQHKAVATAYNVKTGPKQKLEDGGVSFDIGGSRLTYNNPSSLKLDGGTNLDALRAVVLNAQKEGIEGIDFANITNEENRARLYMLSKIYGMKVVNLEQDKIPNVEQELSKLSADEILKFKEATKENEVQEQTQEQEQTQPEPVQDDSKDYAIWRDEVKKNVEKKGEKAVVDFKDVENADDKAKLFLAAKLFGAKVENVDASELDVMKHFKDIPVADQKRLMVLGKKEKLAKDKNEAFYNNREEQANVKAQHKVEIGKTNPNSDERAAAVAQRSAALKALRGR